MSKIVEFIKNVYNWFGFWKYKKELIWNQKLDFGSKKMIIHVPFHLLISFTSAFITYSLYNNVLYAFYFACGLGIATELVLFFWMDFWNDKFSGIFQSLFDIATYCIGAAFIFFMLLK